MEDADLKDMSTYACILGLPKVGPERADVLLKVVTKKCTVEGFGRPVVTLGIDELTRGTTGHAFVKFDSVEAAENVVTILKNHKFDKAHVLTTCTWADFQKYIDTPDEYEPPHSETIAQVSVQHNNEWLDDTLGRPMFLMKTGKAFDVELHWFNPFKAAPELMKKPSANDDLAKTWSELDRAANKLQKGYPQPYPIWSPRGSYLVTVHSTGVRFWSGEQMTHVATELTHHGVQLVHISPCEQYCVTFAKEFCFWNIATAKKIKTLSGFAASEKTWPTFKYSAEDKYIALMKENEILVFDCATMTLVQPDPSKKVTMEIDNLLSFTWSPTFKGHLCAIAKGDEKQPWCISVEAIVERPTSIDVKTLVRRNVFQVVSIQSQWHPQLPLLACKVNKTTTDKPSEFILMRVSDSFVSAEQLDIKGDALRFAWQPNSPRFAIIYKMLRKKSEDTASRLAKESKLAFYSMEKVGVKEINSFETDAQFLFWAPKGGRCIAFIADKFKMDFYSVSEGKKITLVGQCEHPHMVDLSWDPSGRYVTSSVSALKIQLETGFRIWNINGNLVYSDKQERFSHFMWRPMPPSPLTKEEMAAVKANLPQRSREYAADDEKFEQAKRAVAEEQRQKAANEYRTVAEGVAQERQAQVAERERLWADGARRNAKWNQVLSVVDVVEEEEVIESVTVVE